jgi:uncharacterized delta-60 repeat protein
VHRHSLLRVALCILAAGFAIGSSGCAPGVENSAPQCHYQQCVPVPAPLAAGLNASIFLDWPAVANAASYNVYYSTSTGVAPFAVEAPALGAVQPLGAPPPGPAKMPATQPTLTLTGLSPTTQYFAVVTAVDATSHVESSPSPQLTATTQVTGTADTTFGTSGFATMAGDGGSQDTGTAAATDSLGRVIVVGNSLDAGGTQHLAVWRFNVDGSADASFGTGGAVFPAPAVSGGTQDQGNAVTIDSQGRIVVAGASTAPEEVAGLGATSAMFMALWRFLPDGTLDPSFSSGGVVTAIGAATTTGTPGFSTSDEGNAVAIDSQGKIIVAGGSAVELGGGASGGYLALWRFNPDGSPDSSFTDGTCQVGGINAGGTRSGAVGGCIALTDTVPAPGTSGDIGMSVAMDGNGRIVAAGISGSIGGQNMTVWRFNADGSPDSSFGGAATGFLSSGPLTSATGAAGGTGFESANAVTLDGQGRIVVTGSSSAASQQMVIWRLDANGVPDSTFTDSACLVSGVVGGCVLGATGSSPDTGLATAIDSQGNIVVAGTSNGPSLTIWRYAPSGVGDPTWGGAGVINFPTAPAGTTGLSGSTVGLALDFAGRMVVGTSYGPTATPPFGEVGATRITP